jgi:hypothetical protein
VECESGFTCYELTPSRASVRAHRGGTSQLCPCQQRT